MNDAMTRAWVAAGSLAVCLGCQSPAAPPPATQSQPHVTAADLRAEGEARLRARDYAKALTAYQEAVAQDPTSVPARYGLAVALAGLDRKDEAVTAFTWVVKHASGSEEARIARQWLAEANPSPRPVVAAVEEVREEDRRSAGVVEGQTRWDDLNPDRVRPSVQILLEGDDSSTRGRRYWAKVPINDPYRIENVLPGRYRLLAQVGPIRLWDTSVVVQAGATTKLDLLPSASVAPPGALRGPQG